MPKQPLDAENAGPKAFAEYVVDPDRVAEALLARIDRMADERAKMRRSLIYSVEMIETPDVDGRTGSAHQA
jgi:hypothetical protein